MKSAALLLVLFVIGTYGRPSTEENGELVPIGDNLTGYRLKRSAESSESSKEGAVTDCSTEEDDKSGKGKQSEESGESENDSGSGGWGSSERSGGSGSKGGSKGKDAGSSSKESGSKGVSKRSAEGNSKESGEDGSKGGDSDNSTGLSGPIVSDVLKLLSSVLGVQIKSIPDLISKLNSGIPIQLPLNIQHLLDQLTPVEQLLEQIPLVGSIAKLLRTVITILINLITTVLALLISILDSVGSSLPKLLNGSVLQNVLPNSALPKL